MSSTMCFEYRLGQYASSALQLYNIVHVAAAIYSVVSIYFNSIAAKLNIIVRSVVALLFL